MGNLIGEAFNAADTWAELSPGPLPFLYPLPSPLSASPSPSRALKPGLFGSWLLYFIEEILS